MTATKMTSDEIRNLAIEISALDPAEKAIVWAERTGYVSPLITGCNDPSAAIRYLSMHRRDRHEYATAVHLAQEWDSLEDCRSWVSTFVAAAKDAEIKVSVYKRKGRFWVSLTPRGEPVAWHSGEGDWLPRDSRQEI